MLTHEFLLNGLDTDSIMVSKPDGSTFNIEEQALLLAELNALFEDGINWEHDGVYPKVLYLRAKNYILFDGKTIKTKGSSLRDQKKEPAMREFLDTIIKALIDDKPHIELTHIYEQYVKEALNVTDIKRWCSKKSITEKTESSDRANETKIMDAIAGSEYKQADKVYLFFKEDGSLCLAEHFDGQYSKTKMLERLYKTAQVFSSILPCKVLFPNYSLKRAQKELGRFQ